MRIYTRTGDRGETGLLGGARVPKDHIRITAYGEIDELNAQIGLLREAARNDPVAAVLETIQSVLFEAGSRLASPPATQKKSGGVAEQDVSALETAIDKIEESLPPLSTFILPGGTEAAARAHVARAVCRRAERAVVRLNRAEPDVTEVIRYLNRLSDYLFVAARWLNQRAGVVDTAWKSRGTAEANNPSGEPENGP